MLDPQARALIDLMIERGVPPTHTLSPEEARRLYRERRGYTQPEPPAIGEMRELRLAAPARNWSGAARRWRCVPTAAPIRTSCC